jgi:3'-5' exoribonuclease
VKFYNENINIEVILKQSYIENIKERDQVSDVFLVKNKVTAMAKNGKPYLTLKLMDRTGEVEGRLWDRVDELSRLFDKNDFIHVQGKASVYLGKMQLVVQQLTRVDDEQIDLADFLPVSGRDQAGMRSQLDALIATLKDEHIVALLRSFFDNPAFFADFAKAPAAKGMHHVYLGGLLEHSLAVAALASDVSARYADVNRDLLICGALLHDIGKVSELTYARSFDYSDEGKLLGHIVIGVQMVEDQLRRIDGFSPQTALMIKHLLLSHHGQYDYGSPKRPKFLEAVILNYVDDLDSKINGVMSHVAREPQNEGNWTSYHRLYDRYFYTGGMERQEPAATPSQAVVPSRPTPPVQQKAQRKERKNFDQPLGATLAEQLKDKNLDLFSVIQDKGEDS